MDKKCKICKKKYNLPCQLSCDHKFCFMCLKMYISSGNTKCYICGKFITENLRRIRIKDIIINISQWSNIKIIWIYSKRYGNGWWSYDYQSNRRIEKIYQYHLKCQKLMKKKNYNGIKVKLVLQKKNHKRHPHVINNTTNIEEYLCHNIKYDTIDLYEDSTNNDTIVSIHYNSDVDDVDDKINVTQTNKILPDNKITSYTINFGHVYYKMDFVNMLQINMDNTYKRRNIKRIKLTDTDNDIFDAMKNKYRISGIVGIKF